MSADIYTHTMLASTVLVPEMENNQIVASPRAANCKTVRGWQPALLSCENAKSSLISDEAQSASTGGKENKPTLSEPTSVLDLRGSPSNSSNSIVASSNSETESGDGRIACHSSTLTSRDDDSSWVECIFPDYVPPLSVIPSLDDERQTVVISGGNLMEEVIQFHNDFSMDGDMDGGVGMLQHQLYPLELGDLSVCGVLPYVLPPFPDFNMQDHPKNITDSNYLSNRLGFSHDWVSSIHHTCMSMAEIMTPLEANADSSYGCSGSWEASSVIDESKFATAAMPSPAVTESKDSISIVQLIQEVQEENGLQIVHLLLGCVEAIKVGDLQLARLMLSRLQTLSSSLGNPIQRLAVYFTDALIEQMTPIPMMDSSSPIEKPLLCSAVDRQLAYQAFYQTLPFIKFVHLTANQAILESVRENSCIHVVDLDVKQGLQWSSFIQSLAMRPEGAVFLKLTAVGPDEDVLQQTGRRLLEFARSLQVPFQFNGIASTIDNLYPAMFEIEKDDILAVSCPFVLHQLLKNQQELQRVLSMIKSMSPTIVAVLEVEANHTNSFEDRFVESLHYYSAIFDALEYTLDREDDGRLSIESIHLASEVRNVMAPEGSESVIRHMRSECWRGFLSWAGLRDLSFSYSAIYQARLFLSMYSSSYKICEEGFALTLGWHDTPMVSVSTWTC
ncbi:hypothetical protein O6H91_07G069400 [Diphasiastrum complanatum]|uniref:Uncharacterized protein n=1 Tax=Diphasiastrum complanatum TaxID=34168 RepID=A0ACC2D6G0_DIPCM|nr:hypothetical protein O6H91_07G069400 [Diphasiastrum complanatum]